MIEAITKREKFITSVAVAVFLSFTILFFGPINLYFNNTIEFSFSMGQVWYVFLLITIVLVLILTSFLLVIKQPFYEKVVSLIFILSFLFWFESNIMGWSYGVMDGKEINWQDYKVQNYVSSFVWLALLTFSLAKSTVFYNMAKTASIVLIITQIIFSFLTFSQVPNEEPWKKFIFDDSSKFEFSKDRNVIVLVLDSFQSDIFQELLKENPSYINNFTGFTYFRNSLGGYPTTYPSVPLILTGQHYDNSMPIQEYIQKSYLNNSIPLLLKENDYQVDLFPLNTYTVYNSEVIASNVIENTGLNSYVRNSLEEIYTISMLKSLPSYFKSHFAKLNIKPAADLTFFNEMLNKTSSSADKNTFKFFHLVGAHPPFLINEELQQTKLDYNRNNYKIQAKAGIKIAVKFLDKLKEVGAYDSSLIFIIGDHGLGSFNIAVENIDIKSNSTTKLTSSKTISLGTPLFLVKPINSNNDFRTSDVPIILSDIPKTIVSELNIEADVSGRTVFDISETEQRERRFFFYSWENDRWDKEYLPDMHEYIVRGHSWINEAWEPTYRNHTPQGVRVLKNSVYELGSKIGFGAAGNAKNYQTEGWYESEERATWTQGSSASLTIPVQPPSTDLQLTIEAFPFIAGDIREQTCIVFINGTRVGQLNIPNEGQYKINVPKEYVSEELIELTFELPKAASPLELGVSEDYRVLALAIKSITISEMSI